jgi:Fur family ferric uptake transcriptional regulator
MNQKNIEDKLTAKNIQPTAMRLLVLDYLLKQDSAITLAGLEKGLYPADRITIYRTLKTFEDKGVVHAIEDGSGSTKYAMCKEECSISGHHDLHIHFYCINCENTFCLPRTSIPQVDLPSSFVPVEYNLVVKGMCPDCQK